MKNNIPPNYFVMSNGDGMVFVSEWQTNSHILSWQLCHTAAFSTTSEARAVSTQTSQSTWCSSL